MNIAINKTVDRGDLEKERIIFAVKDDDFLGAYLVFKSKKTGEKMVSSKTEATYWFPDKEVKKGDLVVLYTKVGINTEKKNTDGTTSFFFYWGLTDSLWNDSVDAVVLTRLQEWSFRIVSDET